MPPASENKVEHRLFSFIRFPWNVWGWGVTPLSVGRADALRIFDFVPIEIGFSCRGVSWTIVRNYEVGLPRPFTEPIEGVKIKRIVLVIL